MPNQRLRWEGRESGGTSGSPRRRSKAVRHTTLQAQRHAQNMLAFRCAMCLAARGGRLPQSSLGSEPALLAVEGTERLGDPGDRWFSLDCDCGQCRAASYTELSSG